MNEEGIKVSAKPILVFTKFLKMLDLSLLRLLMVLFALYKLCRLRVHITFSANQVQSCLHKLGQSQFLIVLHFNSKK